MKARVVSIGICLDRQHVEGGVRVARSCLFTNPPQGPQHSQKTKRVPPHPVPVEGGLLPPQGLEAKGPGCECPTPFPKAGDTARLPKSR